MAISHATEKRDFLFLRRGVAEAEVGVSEVGVGGRVVAAEGVGVGGAVTAFTNFPPRRAADPAMIFWTDLIVFGGPSPG